MIFLDTNAVIAALEGKPRQVGETIAAQLDQGARIAISSIVAFELWFGVARSRRQEFNRARLQAFLASPVEVVVFDTRDAEVAGTVRATLMAAGTPIGPYDLLIAGQALRHGATLVTANTRELGRVAGLRCEDWGRG